MAVIIYGAILSPFVRKALAFAAEKGIAAELKPGGMGQGGEEFLTASPFAKMPALRDVGAGVDGGDYCLSDSTAICHYLDAKVPEPALIPADARLRGDCVWLDEFADTILMGCGAKMFFNRVVLPRFLKREGDLAAADLAEREELPRILDWLDARIGGADFLVGDRLTLADLSCAVPFANIAGAGYALDAGRHPNVVRWLDGVTSRPSLARATQTMAKILSGER